MAEWHCQTLPTGPKKRTEFPHRKYAWALAAATDGVSATRANLEQLAPQLARDEVDEIWRDSRIKRVTFWGPPVRVMGASNYFVAETSGGQHQVRWATAVRSYDYHPKGAILTHDAWRGGSQQDAQRAAMQYGHETWPDELVHDTAADCLLIHVVKPTADGYMPTGYEFRVAVWLNRQMRDMHRSCDNEAPLCELVNESAFEVSTSPAVVQEMRGSRLCEAAVNCAICSGGVIGGSCVFCGADCRYTLGPHRAVTLPRCVIKAVILSHKFKIPPVNARKAECAAWAADFQRPAGDACHGDYHKQQRSIEI